MRRWTLEEAQTRLGEVVRQARSSGPQLITEHGQDEVVIIAAVEFAKIVRAEMPFVDFMAGLDLGDIDVTRDPDTDRDVSL